MFGSTRSIRTSAATLGECSYAAGTDVARLRLILRVRDGAGGAYAWVSCLGCDCSLAGSALHLERRLTTRRRQTDMRRLLDDVRRRNAESGNQRPRGREAMRGGAEDVLAAQSPRPSRLLVAMLRAGAK